MANINFGKYKMWVIMANNLQI